MSEKKKGIGCCGGIVIIGLLLMGYLVVSVRNPQIPPAGNFDAPRAPVEVAKVDSPPVVSTPSPAAKPPENPKSIRGLSLLNATDVFLKRGFDMRHSPSNDDGTGVLTPQMWELTQKNAVAEFRLFAFAYDPANLESVQASAMTLHTGGDFIGEARGYLRIVAGNRYEGADVEKAQAWIDENVSTNASTEIGGVKFELTGTEFARTLRMTPTR